MERQYTGVNDANGNRIFNDSRVRYTYWRRSRVSSQCVCVVEWGYFADEQRWCWLLGGFPLDGYGADCRDWEREVLEVVE